ncbi:carbohydrate ABC transporter permease [Actinotalea sp. K2]|uniref:carbohydrate ABC transporter permease n=1 Tax=Actinotalea sp. K2 TaxID=2939438 RepID=UPI0020183BEF|nr:carbohydrate ABC transporter permease [Actinotalea sp. K2]MCL3861612.1 carbohydrate ABC transporter permease [Actinotalea sp. K2]
MRRLHIGTSARIIGVLVILGIAVFPLYWMFVTSLTSNQALFGSSAQMFPDLTRLGTYGEALSGNVLRWLMNSTIIAAGTCLLTAVLALPFAYALSRFRFRWKSIIVIGLFLTQMLPEALLVVPLFALFRILDLLNSLVGLILVCTAFVLPIVVFILKGAIDGIPRELEESARIDGCRPFGILTRIYLPLIAPTIAATAVISFFSGWNEYVFAVTFAFDPAMQPMSVGLASFIGELSTPVQTVMAVAVMYTLPAVAFYLFAQKYVVSGMTAGAVKG